MKEKINKTKERNKNKGTTIKPNKMAASLLFAWLLACVSNFAMKSVCLVIDVFQELVNYKSQLNRIRNDFLLSIFPFFISASFIGWYVREVVIRVRLEGKQLGGRERKRVGERENKNKRGERKGKQEREKKRTKYT